MSDSQEKPEPQWELLPDEPQEFFGLADGYDRRDLKRVYTRLIKVHKPERSPDKFKRIRSAYEQLDSWLRNFSSLAVPTSRPEWDQDEAETKPKTELPNFEFALKELGPTGLRDALLSSAHRTNLAWIKLALVEEELSGERGDFARVLIDGAFAGESHGERMDLMGSLCRKRHGAEESILLLRGMLRLLGPSDDIATRDGQLGPASYWYLSGTLWLNLLGRIDFAEFVDLLEECTQRVGPGGAVGRTILDLHLLRRAAWLGDRDWYAGLCADLAERAHGLPDEDQSEYDLALWLLRYRGVREAFLSADGEREKLDRALCAIVEGDEARADLAFYEAMGDFIHDPQACVRNYEAGVPEEALEVLRYWADDLRGRSEEQPSIEDAKPLVRELYAELEGRSSISWPGVLLSLFTQLSLLVSVLVIIGPCVAVGDVEQAGAKGLIPVGVIALLLVASKLGWFERLLNRLRRPMVREAYRRVWRQPVMDFLRENPMTLGQFIMLQEEIEVDDALRLVELVPLLEEDAAMELYAMAQTFA